MDKFAAQRYPKRGVLGGVRALPCQACGVGWMKRKTVSSGNALGLCIALLMVAAGILVSVILVPIGCFLGPLICFVALFIGGKRTKVWRCSACGATISRA